MKRTYVLVAAVALALALVIGIVLSQAGKPNLPTGDAVTTTTASAQEVSITTATFVTVTTEQEETRDNVMRNTQTTINTNSTTTSGSVVTTTWKYSASRTTNTTATEPMVDKADTSGMDFDFNDEDTQAQAPAVGTTINVSQTTKTNNGVNLYTITAGGSYTLSGMITDTMVTIDAGDADVTLILNGATIQNSKGPAIFVRSAGKMTITLAEGTINTVADGTSYTLTDNNSTPDAALFSKADLTVNGSGTLVVNGNYKHGIVSKDDLIISSGAVTVTANNVGLEGKDCVKINSGDIRIKAGSDGIRASNTEDADKGYVYLYGGTDRSCNRFKRALDYMMRVIACKLSYMEGAFGLSHKCKPKFLAKLRIKISYLLGRNIKSVAEIASS